MIKLKLNDKQIDIPSEWEELKLYEWQAISKIDVSNEEESLRNYFLILSIIQIFLNRDKIDFDLMELTIPDIIQVGKNIKYLNDMPISILKNIIKIDKKEYGLEENIFKMSAGAYFDADRLSKGDDILDKLHILMATFYRPIKKKRKSKFEIEKYDTSTLQKRADLFKYNVNALEAASFINFICAHGVICLESFHSFLENITKKQKEELNKIKNVSK